MNIIGKELLLRIISYIAPYKFIFTVVGEIEHDLYCRDIFSNNRLCQ